MKAAARPSLVSRLGVEVDVDPEPAAGELSVDVRSLWLHPLKLGFEELSTDQRFEVVVNSIKLVQKGGDKPISGHELHKRVKSEANEAGTSQAEVCCAVSHCLVSMITEW